MKDTNLLLPVRNLAVKQSTVDARGGSGYEGTFLKHHPSSEPPVFFDTPQLPSRGTWRTGRPNVFGGLQRRDSNIGGTRLCSEICADPRRVLERQLRAQPELLLFQLVEEYHWNWDPKLEFPIHSCWVLVGKHAIPSLADGDPFGVIHSTQDFIFVQRLALIRNLVIQSVVVRLRERRVRGGWELS